LARDRMRKGKPRSVEELALQAEVAGAAVHRIARDREPDRLEVNADLVRAAGFERDAEESVGAQQLDDLEMRDRLARSVRVERVARRVAAVAADRRLDPPRARARPPGDEREVLALHLPLAHELL